MANRDRLRSAVSFSFFVVPFALVGVGLFVLGLREQSILLSLLGTAGFGLAVSGPVREWLRIGKSQERLTAGRRSNLLRQPEPLALPHGPTGYRSLALVERTEVITLDKLPLPQIPRAQGTKLAFAVAPTSMTGKLVVSHGLLVGLASGVLLQLVAFFKEPSVRHGVLALVLAAGTFVTHLWARERRRAARLRPEVELSAEPATLGQELDIHVRLPNGLRTPSLAIALVCEEIAVGSGDEGVTHTAELHRQKLWSGRVTKSSFAKDLRCALPKRGATSFDLGANRVQWAIEISFSENDGDHTIRKVPFRVLPKAPPGVVLLELR